MQRDEITRNLAILLKDQLTNPTFHIVRRDFSEQSYIGAADAMLGYIEGKLNTPWETLHHIFCPPPRTKITEPEHLSTVDFVERRRK